MTECIGCSRYEEIKLKALKNNNSVSETVIDVIDEVRKCYENCKSEYKGAI